MPYGLADFGSGCEFRELGMVRYGRRTGALSCFAKMMANTLMEVVPPFNFLSKLEKMMEEFPFHTPRTIPNHPS